MMTDRNSTKGNFVNNDYNRLLAEETLILDVQIAIQQLLNVKGLTQADLARKLGVGESYVSQMLGASARNLTLRTVARVMAALDEVPQLTVMRTTAPMTFEQTFESDADFGPWGEIVTLDDLSQQFGGKWCAQEWAANENNISEPEWAEAA